MPRGLEDYVTVDQRLGEFWEKYPQGRILTEIEYPDENTVRCRAQVFRDYQIDWGTPQGVESRVEPKPAATGHAEEKRDEGHVNKTSAVENCETSAVGRALALMGFSIHKGIASREEVEIAQRKAGAMNAPQNAAQSLPERYVDTLRMAIHSKDKSEAFPDGDEWASVVGAATTNDQKKALVEQLEAVARDVGLDPVLIRQRWEASRA